MYLTVCAFALPCDPRRPHPVFHVEFGAHRPYVVLDGFRTDAEDFGDAAIGQPVAEKRQDFMFAQ